MAALISVIIIIINVIIISIAFYVILDCDVPYLPPWLQSFCFPSSVLSSSSYFLCDLDFYELVGNCVVVSLT